MVKVIRDRFGVRIVYIFSVFFIFFFVLLYIFEFHFPIFEYNVILVPLENKWFDFKFNLNNVFRRLMFVDIKKSDPRILIAAIDDKTLEKYGWPIPRRYYKDLFVNLNKYGVKVIGVDVFFLEEDKNNPVNDKIFVDTVKNYDNIILGFPLDENGNIKYPFSALHKASYNFGSIANLSLDPDGSIRKIKPFFRELEIGWMFKTYTYGDICPHCNDNIKNLGIPLLGMMAYIKYNDADFNEIYNKWFDKSFYINFRKHLKLIGDDVSTTAMYKSISFRDIIEDRLSDDEKKLLKGAVVFVGSTAQGAFDHYPTPVSHHTPGVEIHALCVDNLLNNDYLKEVPWYITVILMVFSILLPFILMRKTIGVIAIYNFSAMFILMYVSLIAIKYNMNFLFMTNLIPNLVSFIFIAGYKSAIEDRQKRWIKNTFSQYLSPEVVDIIVKDPSKLRLGGERKEISILFMDIAGFTNMSEKMTPEDVINLLNRYLSILSDIILDERGVIDKYIGDCIMAFWNAPLDVEKHKLRSVSAALRCVEKIKDINRETNYSVNVRIGINSGYAVVGNMGSDKRFAYTAVGDTVNLASRLEGVNKFFGTSIIASSTVYEGAKDEVVFKYIGKVLVVGKTVAIDVYEPFKFKNEMKDDDIEFIDNFENGIKYFYEQKFDESILFFNKAFDKRPDDGLTNFYINLIRKIMSGEERFSDVFNIRSK